MFFFASYSYNSGKKEVCCSSGQCYALILLKSQDRITDSLKAVVRIRIQKEMKNGRGIFS